MLVDKESLRLSISGCVMLKRFLYQKGLLGGGKSRVYDVLSFKQCLSVRSICSLAWLAKGYL